VIRRRKDRACDAETRERQVAELEEREERDRHDEADDLARRIAVAECARHDHVEPDDGPLADTVDITAWGLTTPIRIGPHCARCGANLSKETT
jgi:hypothetical protein